MSNPQWARSRKVGVVIAVVATNVLPIAGVLLLGWKAFHIALLYWFEVFVIGATEVVAQLVQDPEPEATKRIRANILQSSSMVMRAVHWGRLIGFQLFRRVIGVLVTTFVFGIMAAMYGLAILHYLSDQWLPPPPQALVEHTMIAVPAAILIYIFTTSLKWPAFVILIRFVAGGIANLVTWWRSDGRQPRQRSSSTFLMHILFLHLASLAVILLINVLGSPEAAILVILVGKAAVELFIVRYDLADV